MPQIREVFLEPSHDIHLARRPAAASKVRLTVLYKEELNQPNSQGHDYFIDDVTQNQNTDILIKPPQGGTILVDYDSLNQILYISSLTGNSTGYNNIELTYINNGTIKKTGIKVHVHNSLNAWWMGNQRITVPVHPHVYHCQATIYAHFDAPSQQQANVIADITGHDYIDFLLPGIAPTDPAPIATLDPDNRGRIRGNRVGLTQLRATFDGQNQDIDLQVDDFYGNPSNWGDMSTIPPGNTLQILERASITGAETRHSQDPSHVKGRGINDRFNLLFVSEGFTSSEKYLFEAAVQLMSDRLFSSPIHHPFGLLSGNFNIWKAFIPSHHSGITRGQGYTHGNPLPPTQPYLFQAKDTGLGLYHSHRPSDQLVISSNNVIGDPRRYPHHVNWIKAICRQLSILSYINILGPGGTPARLGKLWYNDHPNGHANAFLKDMGLVCIIVNDNSIKFPSAHYGYFLVTGLQQYAMTKSRVFVPQRPANSYQWKIHDQQSLNTRARVLASFRRQLDDNTETLAHELSHAFSLGDEYETAGGLAGGAGQATRFTESEHGNVAVHTAVHHGALNANPPAIDPNRLRWSKLHRVVRSDRIVSINTNTSNPANLILAVTLDTNNAARWNNLPAGHTRVYLREFRIIPDTNTPPEPDGSLYGPGGLLVRVNSFRFFPNPNEDDLVVLPDCTVQRVIGNNQVELSVPRASLPAPFAGTPNGDLPALVTRLFAPGGLMYLPKRYTTGAQANNPIFLVDYEVLAYMNTSHAPLHSNWNPGTNACAPPAGRQSVDHPPANMTSGSGRRYPAHPFLILGGYEGADHASCKAYRPAGTCKMKDSHSVGIMMAGRHLYVNPNLCYFCKYNITHIVNPQFLEMLEVQYPDFR